MTFVTIKEGILRVSGDGVDLRQPGMQHYKDWSALRAASRGFLEPWEPAWPPDDLTRGAYRRRLHFYNRAQREDHAYPFFIVRRSDGALLGGCTLSNIRRGVLQAGVLGYWIGAAFGRQGYMTAALRALLPYAFNELKLHRVEAGCLPENVASRNLLQKLGFYEEGLARGYLRIAGRWRDHVLFAMLADDVRHV